MLSNFGESLSRQQQQQLFTQELVTQSARKRRRNAGRTAPPGHKTHAHDISEMVYIPLLSFGANLS
jgi:hypothetical protein